MLKYKDIQNGSIKDIDVKQGIITGYFAAFNNIDNGGDMILPGAFKKSIQERGKDGKDLIFHLLQHDTEKILGKPQVLKEDNNGLYFESKIVKTSFGIDTLKLYEEGVYNQHSIGYREIKTEVMKNEGYQRLHEVKLFEGSTVTWGMNENTPFTGMKSIESYDFFNKQIDKISKGLKVAGLTDETYQLLEIELEKLKTLLSDLPENKPQNEVKAVNEWDFLKQISINLK